ncbi:CesD/SycD/LcrH family type III secretion system chaperone [Pantoea cypripedii]|uniref:CesD/SycD/LcrH family type III secretion system chaperone n=1 Tax=Pantoea cypripedii TaxID=55209 RepID=UPI002FC774F8
MDSQTTTSSENKSVQLEEFLQSGGSLHLLSGIAQDDLDEMESYASQLFASSEFSESRNIYLILSTLDHWNIEYMLGLGLCHQRLGDHRDALHCFSRVGIRTIEDPRAAFFSGLSLRLMGADEAAQKAFHSAVLCSGEQQQFQEIKNSAQQMLNTIKEKQHDDNR